MSKRCTKCGEVKPLEEFSRRPETPDGHRADCRACQSARNRAWRQANPDYHRAWHAANAGYNQHYYEENMARCKELQRVWRREHPDREAERKARRRAREAGLGIVERIDRMAIYERDGGRCHFCGRKVSRDGFHLDHLIPLSWPGAEHSARNLAVAHPSCNARSKAGRLPAQLLMVG